MLFRSNNNGLSFFAYHEPDMKIPIFNSLYEELNNKKFFKNDFFCENKKENKLFFFKPDFKKYPSSQVLDIANKYGKIGFIMINVFNELLVNQFLNKKISFSDIVRKLLLIMRSNRIKKYLKINKIKHINDVFKTYIFCKGILN